MLSYLAPKAGVSNPSIARQPLYPDTSPLNVYTRLFGSALPPGSTPAQLLAQHLSAVNYMRRDLARLRSVVPASEKDRLDAYASAISQLEASLRAKYGSAGGSTCVTPSQPPSFPSTSTGKQGSGSVYSDLAGVDYYVPGQPTSHPHVDLGQTQLRLIKAAFACDSGPGGDVHVGIRDQLGGVPRHVPGSDRGWQLGVGASPPRRAVR